ncbi:glycerol ethanol, ferric requiring protein [Coemansia erecta]|uniref:Chloride channel protein n=1 Tax=Coemansia erecta TaxID=147472 RepID=A0A9W7XS27_9FUNG|nr:glycerol ethanol, ferric requiring protein [Coemansia erecta]
MDEAKSTARFDEFTTVDWMDDAARERQQQLAQLAQHTHGAWWQTAYADIEAWLVVGVSGVLIGVLTALISIVTEWLSDLKLGTCATGWWLNRKFCCWQHDSADACAAWRTWDAAMGVESGFVRWAAFVALGTAMAATCAHLVRSYAPLAAGSGLPEIKAILSGFVIGGFMGAWTLAMKSVGLALAVGSGLSVGKEGPAVHMGCCVGSVVARRFARLRRSAAAMREAVAASAAAGVAVAFGAPIGGVLFALEDLSTRFPRRTLWRSFFCALLATVSLQAMDPFWTGKLVLFQASYDRDWRFFELPFFVLLGVFGGVYGGTCIRLNLHVARFRRRRLRHRAVAEAAVLALATAAVAYANRFTRRDMGELLGELLQECRDGAPHGLCAAYGAGARDVAWALLGATAIRAAGTVLAYGCRVPCGIFVPSMAIGASFGRLVGVVAQALQQAHPAWRLFAHCAPDAPCITPATYAFLGAAAAMCGVTKVAVAVVVIMYELTGALNFIVPTMIVVIVARVVGDAIVEGGISEQLILLNGLPLLDDADIDAVNEMGEVGGISGISGITGAAAAPGRACLPVAAIMRPVDDVVVLPAAGLTRAGLDARLHDAARQGVRGFPVVDNDHDLRLVGYASTEAVARARARASAAAGDSGAGAGAAVSLAGALGPAPVTVRPHMAAETAVEIFCKLGPRLILVTAEDGAHLLGLLTRKDVLRHIRAAHA